MKVRDYATVLLQNSQEAFEIIHKYFYNVKNTLILNEITSNLGISENNFIIEDLFSYFICKLYRIGINYYKEFEGLLNNEQNGFNKGKEFEKAIVKVLTSDSHACFKLKRVYYFLNFSKGKDTLKFVAETEESDLISWTLKELNSKTPESLDYLKSIKNDKKNRNYSNAFFHLIDKHFFEENDLAWRIPPSVFQTNCLVENIKSSKKRVNLNELSSGESQFIYALQTILYHIINIDSNKEYKNIVLLLDEIELYYHPEYQRVFLNTLLTQINELKLNHIQDIQIIFLTHSPFILSDIPSSNILRLIEGKSEPEDTQTFGANIHDLLANDFFLKKGSMGEFAQVKIDEVIGWLNIQRIQKELNILKIEVEVSEKESLKKEIIKTKTKELEELKNRIPKLSKNYCSSIIDIIDEPLLKYTLDEMYNAIYPQTKDKKLEEIRNFAKKIGRNDIANKLDDLL
jgi:hypothetical protein